MAAVLGLTAHGAGEVVEALEAGASFEADVVPGAGAVVVGVEEVLDVREVPVDAESLPLEERGVGCRALLQALDVVL